ncbi:MAG: hypothetical protein KA797_06830 [Chitinophagales bacterium]|nr:hypothetical protein [Chitinophagales bacterium]
MSLLAFSSQEKKRCKRYLSSHTHSSHALKILECFEKFGEKTDKWILHDYLYCGNPYNDVNFRKTLSNFKPLLDAFLLDHANSIDTKKVKALQSLKSKETGNAFGSALKKIRADEMEDEKVNIDLQLLQSIELMESIEQKNIRSAEPNLQAVLNALDHKYLIEKLKIACSALNFASINAHQYELGILDSIDEYLDKKVDRNQPLIFLYYHTYLFLKEQKQTSFEWVFDYMTTQKMIRSEETIHLFTMCINHCIRLINKGDRSKLRILFALYQKQIETGCVYDSFNKISPHTFKNTLNLALNLQEFDWAKSFIESNKTHLPQGSQEEDYLFAKARLNYELKNYRECIRLIMQSKAIDPLNNLSMRVLQIKALYMLEDTDGVDMNIQNAKLYLLRLKHKAYQMAIYKNFFLIMQKIIRAPKISGAFAANILREMEEKQIAEKPWIKGIIG